MLKSIKARGFLREADKKEAQAEAFSGPSRLAGETYQSLFDQVGAILGQVAVPHTMGTLPVSRADDVIQRHLDVLVVFRGVWGFWHLLVISCAKSMTSVRFTCLFYLS